MLSLALFDLKEVLLQWQVSWSLPYIEPVVKKMGSFIVEAESLDSLIGFCVSNKNLFYVEPEFVRETFQDLFSEGPPVVILGSCSI